MCRSDCGIVVYHAAVVVTVDDCYAVVDEDLLHLLEKVKPYCRIEFVYELCIKLIVFSILVSAIVCLVR